MRTDHPPTCMHPECLGRAFASHHNLRAHQKLHEQQEAEVLIYNVDGVNVTDAEGSQPRKRRRGGELGRDWKCDFADCGKDFKTVRSTVKILVMPQVLIPCAETSADSAPQCYPSESTQPCVSPHTLQQRFRIQTSS